LWAQGLFSPGAIQEDVVQKRFPECHFFSGQMCSPSEGGLPGSMEAPEIPGVIPNP